MGERKKEGEGIEIFRFGVKMLEVSCVKADRNSKCWGSLA